MFNLIEKLRRKPEKTKKLIAFSTALSFTGIIFVVWLSVVFPDFRKSQQKEDTIAKLEPSPITTFGETIGTGFSAIGEQFSKLKESVSSMTSSITQNSTFYSTTTNSSANVSSAPIFIEATTSLPDENGVEIPAQDSGDVSTSTEAF
jgi:hypothetical protein